MLDEVKEKMDLIIEKRKTINFPVFGYKIIIILTNSIQATLSKVARKHNLDIPERDAEPQALHLKVPHQGLAYIMLEFDSGPAVSAHESFHAASRMLQYVGAQWEEEIMAYHIDHIVHQIELFHETKAVKEIKKKLDNLKKP